MKKMLMSVLGLVLAGLLGGCEVKNPTASFSSEELADPNPKLTVTKHKVRASRERDRKGDVIAFKGIATPVNGSLERPTAVRGMTGVKVLEAVMSVNNDASFYLDGFWLKGGLSEKDVFTRVVQNVRIMFSNNTQIGITGTVTDTPSRYEFGTSAVMPGNASVLVSVYVNFSSGASDEDLLVINQNTGALFTLLRANAVNTVSNEIVRVQGIVEGSDVYLAEHGEVRMQFAVDNPQQPVVFHPGEYYVIKNRIFAQGEDVSVSKFSPVIYTSNVPISQCVDGVYMYDGGIYVGYGLPYDSGKDNMAMSNIYMDPFVNIPAGAYKDLDVKYYISPDCPIGTRMSFTMHPTPDLIEFRGVQSGELLPLDHLFEGPQPGTLTGVVVPKGCVSEKGYSLETGEPCGQ